MELHKIYKSKGVLLFSNHRFKYDAIIWFSRVSIPVYGGTCYFTVEYSISSNTLQQIPLSIDFYVYKSSYASNDPKDYSSSDLIYKKTFNQIISTNGNYYHTFNCNICGVGNYVAFVVIYTDAVEEESYENNTAHYLFKIQSPPPDPK